MNTSNKLPKVIGIAGTFGSGKDSIATYLQQKYGYLLVSTSDMVRRAAAKKYGSIERPILLKTATELRYQNGAGAMVQRALKEFEDSGNSVGVVITGIRSMGELKTLVKSGGLMVFTDADIELRFERVVKRARDTEAVVSREEFAAREEAEYHTGDNDADFNRRDIRAYCQKAGTIIWNNNDQTAFHQAIDEVLQK